MILQLIKKIFIGLLTATKRNNIKDSTFTIAFGDDVYPFPGNISLIDRAVDPQTGTIKVRLIFPNDKGHAETRNEYYGEC